MSCVCAHGVRFSFCSIVVRVVQQRFRPENKAVFRRGTEAAANGKEIKETGEKGLVNLIGLFIIMSLHRELSRGSSDIPLTVIFH